MIKLVLLGMIGALAASGGASIALMQMDNRETADATEENGLQIESIPTELAAVPVINEGKVTGYLVLRVTCGVDRSQLKQADVLLGPYLSDAVFRAAFDFASEGVSEIKSKHIEQLAQTISTYANEKLGGNVVTSVNLEQLNLVSAGEIRDRFVKPQ
jgi:flagellar basal body-associated protein FliL